MTCSRKLPGRSPRTAWKNIEPSGISQQRCQTFCNQSSRPQSLLVLRKNQHCLDCCDAHPASEMGQRSQPTADKPASLAAASCSSSRDSNVVQLRATDRARQHQRSGSTPQSDSLYARARVNVNLELSGSGNGVRNGFRSGQFAESALDTLYVARNRG
jgi:hypothetical protein